MKKIICAVIAAMLSMLCFGCGETEQVQSKPQRIYHIVDACAALYDNGNVVGGYHLHFDMKKTPRITLEVGKIYDIRVWGHEYLGGIDEIKKFTNGRKHGFDPDVDIMHSPFESKARRKENCMHFEYDDDVMTIGSQPVSYEILKKDSVSGEESASSIETWDEYNLMGLKPGEVEFIIRTKGVYRSDAYNPICEITMKLEFVKAEEHL